MGCSPFSTSHGFLSSPSIICTFLTSSCRKNPPSTLSVGVSWGPVRCSQASGGRSLGNFGRAQAFPPGRVVLSTKHCQTTPASPRGFAIKDRLCCHSSRRRSLGPQLFGRHLMSHFPLVSVRVAWLLGLNPTSCYQRSDSVDSWLHYQRHLIPGTVA